MQDFFYRRQFLHFVMEEKHLSATVEFVVYYALYFVLVEEYYFGLYRDTVGRGRVDYTQVTGTQKREL